MNIAARLFESGMDIMSIETTKLNAIQNMLGEINQLTNHWELPALVGRLLKADMGGFMQFSVHPDLKQPNLFSLSRTCRAGIAGEILHDDEKTIAINRIGMKNAGDMKRTESRNNKAKTGYYNWKQYLATYMMAKEDRKIGSCTIR
jgi:hypothetical protein